MKYRKPTITELPDQQPMGIACCAAAACAAAAGVAALASAAGSAIPIEPIPTELYSKRRKRERRPA